MISIAIVTLNNPEYLDLTIKSLIRNSSEEFEVLIHVNEYPSQQDSKISQVLNKWHRAGEFFTHVTTSRKNQFCARPLNNLFNNYAKGDYFIFLDDDIYVAWGWDSALIQKLSQCKYQWLSPTLYYPKCNHQPSRYNTKSFGMHPRSFDVTAFNNEWKNSRNITEDNKNWISGAGLISRELWNEIGGYDEQFKLGEDVDIKATIWDAAQKAGESYDFRSIADSVLYHFGHAGSDKRSVIVDPFKLFKDKWHMTITEFYKKALPDIEYL